MRQFNVAVVGATGAVGEAMIEILEERQRSAVKEPYLLGERAFGRRGDQVQWSFVHLGERLDQFDFAGVDIGLFSDGASISASSRRRPLKRAASSSTTRQVPLRRRHSVRGAGNNTAVAMRHPRRIIANPNCSTIQMVVALKPISTRSASAINVATYRSVSGAGAKGIRELAGQTTNMLNASRSSRRRFRARSRSTSFRTSTSSRTATRRRKK